MKWYEQKYSETGFSQLCKKIGEWVFYIFGFIGYFCLTIWIKFGIWIWNKTKKGEK